MTRTTSLVLAIALVAGLAAAQPMGGSYTIKPSGGDFSDFGTACAALLSRGYTRSCTMWVYTGTYTAWGNAMNFPSDSVEVVFKAAPGNRPVQTYAGYGLNITGTDHLTFDSIWFSTGNHCLYGTGLKKLTVRNCSLVTTGSGYGASVSADSCRFENNVTYGNYGFALGGGSDDNIFVGNKIYVRSSYGIYLSGTPYKLRNTFINNFVAGYTSYGMYCSYDSMTRLYFNSFYSSGSQPNLYLNYSYRLRAVNNIVHAGSGYCFYATANASLDTSNYNCLYTTGSYVGYINGTTYTWSSWRALGYDANSINANPVYAAPPDLHISEGSPCVGAGTSYAGVSTDIDGMGRSSPPCIGADEVITTPQDVGCTRLLAPTGTVDSGVAVTPACSVYNYGTTTPASYAVRMRVGSYNQTATVTDHAPGTTLYVEFPDWIPGARGTFPVSCSTECPLDSVASNDKQTGTVMVELTNVACTRLIAPVGDIDSSVVIVPACSVYNRGTTTPPSYVVRMKVGSYDGTATVTNHAPGTALYVEFPNWAPDLARGRYAVSCSTELAGDAFGDDDKQSDSITVLVKDVALIELSDPIGSFPEDTFVQARGTWRNNGTQAAAFETWALFNNAAGTRVYAEKLDMVGLIPGGTVQVGTFPPCTLKTPGTWTVRCSTYLAGDVVPGNDFLDRAFTVTPGSHEGGWACKSAMPLSPSGKELKDGAWLVEDGNYIYAAKGFKTGDFYSYDPVNDGWTQLLSWPAGREAKGPYKGAVGVAGGAGIYATKGNNTQGFWLYDIGANTWTQKSDVPLGPTNKKVKGGTDLVYVNAGHGQSDVDYVYLLKGYKNEFWRYNTATDSWQQLPDAPAGVNARWDKGSWLVGQKEPGQPPKPYTLFAHKAKYHEFWKYTTDGDTWFSVPLTPMPIASYTGKNRRSRDGGSGALLGDYIYAFKGANTQEFWRYDIAGNAWTEKETIPQVGGGSTKRKKVKGGGDLVPVGDLVFAIKGNKSPNIWQYTPSTFFYEPRPDRDGVMAERIGIVADALTVGPNQLSTGFATVRYSLPRAGAVQVTVCDLTGRSVMTRTLAAGRSGSTTLDLRSLSAGVYLVKLSSGGYATTQKLVVQR